VEPVTFLKAEATRGGHDLTALVVRHLHGLRTLFGLPAAPTAIGEAFHKAFGLVRYEYLLHLAFERSLALREKGPSFDSPDATAPKRR